jgi:multidrug efflux pump subunit AcrA (membrane-fusion protein)
VKTGAAVDDLIEIVGGVKPGEVVVAKGSFAVRAEAERLGARAPSHH